MNFPDWAPPSVIERWQKCTQENEEELARGTAFYRDLQEKGELSKDYDAETLARKDPNDALDVPGMINRLLTDEKMEWVWKRLQKLEERNQQHRRKPIEAIFILVVEHGFYGPVTRIERMPTAQFLKWVADVQATAAKLAGLVECTGLDDYLWRDFKKAQVAAIFREAVADGLRGKDCKCSEFSDLFYPLRLSELLTRLSGEVETAEKGGMFNRDGYTLSLAAPMASYAQQQYFAQTLTKFCAETFGGPQRRIVSAVASVVFEKNLSERQIIRLAPDIYS